MKKNVILLVVDSVDYNRLETAKDRGINDLFLSHFENKCVSAKNMFSQAPYTEAATMALYCGQRTLDKGGYLEKFNKCPTTIFEAFNNEGYDVFFNGYQPHIFPSSLTKGINHCFYNCGFNFADGFWYYRLTHYLDVYKKGDLKDKDWDFLFRAYEDNFNEWKLFLERWMDNDISLELIRDLAANFNAEEALRLLEEQINIYNSDKKKFVVDVFEKEKEHPLFKIPTMVINEKIKDREFLLETSRKYKHIIKKIQRKNFSRNLFNNFLSMETIREFKRIFVECTKKKDYNLFLRYGYAWYTQLLDPDLKARIAPDYDNFKISPDIDSHFAQFLSWKERNKDSEKPYFACIHVEGMHNPEVFFSHDSTDRNLLDNQFKKIENYVDNLPKNYKGAITYDLSIIHHSERIEENFKKLVDLGVIDDNTYFIVTADHGYSFTGDPVRERYVTNFYLENYKIPFMIFNKNLEPCAKEELLSSDDLPATLLDLCSLNKPSNFTGTSILKEESNRDFCFIEYLGSGCPDMDRREFHYAIFNKKYFISVYVKLNEEINEDCIKDIFNLVEDPKQLKNLKGKVSVKDEELSLLFNELVKRHNEVREENMVK